ncbi:1-pyrroline-5-carboxylate dehydrogenase [Exophiala xenobiotica]|uniref:1-pyrroline-5-carboxylate dehydrogenase n=1 Tax=Exophiala xenobiotica TaxID=348802 RepID=A0A0D2C027_9EURO|nr:1-pyrroline-5-carboxylate dehydrogenase [Exophiala xenobiotica]KIW58061.1 1-pyrroline-5-carboxylate dehydrogenase [Exophiala xenobiotica]
MLGQGKNAWQAEIDAAAELADFYRYNVSFAEEIYSRQPMNERGQAGRTEWGSLEGFVYVISPFNFTAIGGNLISGPALLGNVVLWKPSASNIYASYLVYKILREAGLPPNVIQFTNGDAEMVTKVALDHTELSAIDFTGSSSVFRSLFGKIADGVREKQYRDFPGLVAETSGKNFHLVHKSADISNAVNIRSAPPSKQFLSEMKHELASVKVGPPEDFGSFTGPVINQAEFDKVTKAIDASNKDSQLELVTGGKYDSREGLYIEPTLYVAKNADHPLFDRGLFGPVLVAYVYPDAEFDWVLEKIDQKGGGFALTGAIFANDTMAIRKAENRLRYAAGNFYTNCKTNGAVIGQQSFGGARGSGTNDKAGSANMLMRFTAPRTLKEDYNTLDNVLYPSNA